jgi:CPA2 family monovalent cation:H+ antiporter-2
VDRKLPAPLQTFASLYGSWIDRLRRSSGNTSGRSGTRRLVRLLLIDAVLIVAVVIGAALEAGRASALLIEATGMAERTARAIVLAGAAVVGLPLLIGLMRTAGRLARDLSFEALPGAESGKVDFANAPRRALAITLQLAIIAAIGVPMVAVMMPFLPSYRFALAPLVLVAVPAIAFWRSTMNLQGHTKAGAEVLAMKLGQQMAGAGVAEASDDALQHEVHRVHQALPGLGEPASVRVPADSPAADRTLAELNLRGATGATVLAIIRQGEQVLVPSGRDRVLAGDLLAVAGSEDAIAAAREVIASPQ